MLFIHWLQTRQWVLLRQKAIHLIANIQKKEQDNSNGAVAPFFYCIKRNSFQICFEFAKKCVILYIGV